MRLFKLGNKCIIHTALLGRDAELTQDWIENVTHGVRIGRLRLKLDFIFGFFLILLWGAFITLNYQLVRCYIILRSARVDVGNVLGFFIEVSIFTLLDIPIFIIVQKVSKVLPLNFSCI